MKQWYSMRNPFAGNKTQITIFDFSQVLLVTILFIHCLTNLFIAKESACIYWNELKNEALSKCLDDKSKSSNQNNNANASQARDPGIITDSDAN